MQASVKIALAAGAALVAAVGVGVAVSKSASAAPANTTPTPGVPPAGSTVWVRATSLSAGQTVRVSLSQAALAAIPGMPSLDMAGFNALLATPTIVNLLGATTFDAWGPGGPALPADWPPDDVGAATEYHAQFVYGENGAALPTILVTAIPIPGLIAWVPKGTGA